MSPPVTDRVAPREAATDISKQAVVWRGDEACPAQQESFLEVLGCLPITIGDPKTETFINMMDYIDGTGLSSQDPDEERKEGEHEQGRQDREGCAHPLRCCD
ncbi:hypothetical protein LEMLEM_LOCUS3869 [Lemmus lemmus]